MAKEITITVGEAVNLWEHLETMVIEDETIYTGIHHHKRKPDFFVFFGKSPNPKVAHADDICTVTFHNYQLGIKLLQEKQAAINAFLDSKGIPSD